MKIKVVMLKRLLGGIDYGFGYILTNCPLWCLGDVLLFDPSGLHCRGAGAGSPHNISKLKFVGA
jgi:hypothetical protein